MLLETPAENKLYSCTPAEAIINGQKLAEKRGGGVSKTERPKCSQ